MTAIIARTVYVDGAKRRLEAQEFILLNIGVTVHIAIQDAVISGLGKLGEIRRPGPRVEKLIRLVSHLYAVLAKMGFPW